MSEKEPVFKGELKEVDNFPFEAPLTDERERTCKYYTSSYARAAKEAKEAGDTNTYEIYKFLRILTSFSPDFGDPAHPYRPMWIMDGQRSLVPDDLLESDFLAIREIASQVNDPALRAQLYDILWIGERNHLDCREAATSYHESARQLDENDDWTFAATQFYRGLQLSSKLGRNQDSYKTISAELVAAIERTRESEVEYRTSQFLSIAIEFQCGEPGELAEIAKQIGDRAKDANDHRKSRSYWSLEAKLRRGEGAEDLGLEAEQRAAETLVLEAENRATGKNGSFLAAAGLLKEGIEALRRARVPKERIDELRTILAEYQRNSVSEMQRFETSVDISEAVTEAKNHVKGQNLFEALQRFALDHTLIDVDQLREEVTQNIKEFPIQHLFAGSMVDAEGRSTAEIPNLLNLEGEEAEKAIEGEMFANASRFIWGIRTSSFIEPARVQILNEHHPTLHSLAFLVQNNPFVPPGHEGVFLRGIHAGFHGDFLVAAHLLVPQIENSMRHVLSINGVDVSILNSDGTQPLKMLGGIFDIEETLQIFGESIHFELRGLLIEKTGADFRNRIAHGFATEGECYGPAAVNLWWLVLRLCLIPILQATEDATTELPE